MKDKHVFRVYTLKSGLLILIPSLCLCFPVFYVLDHYGPDWMQARPFKLLGGAVLLFGIFLVFARMFTVEITAELSVNGLSLFPEQRFWSTRSLEQDILWNQMEWWQFDQESSLGHGQALVDVFSVKCTDGRHIRLYIYESILGQHTFEPFLTAFQDKISEYNQRNPVLPIRQRKMSSGVKLKYIVLLLLFISFCLSLLYILVADPEFFFRKLFIFGPGLLLFGYGAWQAFKKMTNDE